MCVDVIRATVGGPAGVANAGRTVEGITADLIDAVDEVLQFSFLLFQMQGPLLDNCDTSGVVSAVFHSLQRIQSDLERFGVTYVANDCTHASDDTQWAIDFGKLWGCGR